MPKLFAALWLCGVAAGQALPSSDHAKETAPRSAGNTAKAPHAHRFPWHYMRHLGEIEVNLAIRFSSIGIRDAGLDSNAEGGQVRQAVGNTLPDTSLEQAAAK